MLMNVRRQIAMILAMCAVYFMVDNTAIAKTVSLAQGQKIIDSCNGAHWSAGGTTATSGCMNKDGHGVVCGGVKPSQKNNCSTFAVVNHDARQMAGRFAGAKSAP
jgi:hypothetical protein